MNQKKVFTNQKTKKPIFKNNQKTDKKQILKVQRRFV
jgi:hypothetical protein